MSYSHRVFFFWSIFAMLCAILTILVMIFLPIGRQLGSHFAYMAFLLISIVSSSLGSYLRDQSGKIAALEQRLKDLETVPK
jgi:hypothetical protein